jgi:uncharacterized membrane protein
MAVVFDVVTLATGDGYWSELAYWMMASGIVTGLLAAPFGFIDWLGIPSGTRAKRIGAVHGIGNVIVVLLFATSWLMRGTVPSMPDAMALALSFGGGLLALFTGWLGGELVDRLSVGVDDGAHVDAPSSITTRHLRAS